MNKKIKFSLVVIAVIAIAVFAQSGAWAGKLQGNNESPSVASNEGARPMGTTTVKIKTARVSIGTGMVHKIQPFKLDAKYGAKSSMGTFYYIDGGDNTVSRTVQVEVGPNWEGTVSYWLGDSWLNAYWEKDGNIVTFVFPSGAEFFIISVTG